MYMLNIRYKNNWLRYSEIVMIRNVTCEYINVENSDTGCMWREIKVTRAWKSFAESSFHWTIVKVSRSIFRSIEKSDWKQSLARPRRGFISAMRITMLLFHPVSYRVGHHRHHIVLPLYGAPSYIPFMSLSCTLRLVSPSSRRRYYASRISTVRDRFTISIESNFFHGQQQREPIALVHSRRELARRCGGQCVSYYPLYWPNGVYTEAYYRSQLFQLSFPFLALSRWRCQDGMRNSSPRDVPRVLIKYNVNRCLREQQSSLDLPLEINIARYVVRNFSQSSDKIVMRDSSTAKILR